MNKKIYVINPDGEFTTGHRLKTTKKELREYLTDHLYPCLLAFENVGFTLENQRKLYDVVYTTMLEDCVHIGEPTKYYRYIRNELEHLERANKAGCLYPLQTIHETVADYMLAISAYCES